MERILIFTDGASKGNPGPGGWGALIANDTAVRELGGREEHTTNNRMELRGAIEALSFAASLPPAPIQIYCDSSYVIHGATKWTHGWKKRGWKTAQNEDVQNRDLWERLLEALERCSGPIAWEYVGGHVGIAGNERVDQIASAFAKGESVELYAGTRAAYPVGIENISFDHAKHAEKSASRSRAKLAAYSYVSKVDGVVAVHKTWAECAARVKGKRGARFKKAISAAEEAEIRRDFSSR